MEPKSTSEISDNSSKTRQNSRDILPTTDFSSSLSDVGLYSLSGLVAVSLIQLFEDDCHREFRRKTLEKVLQDLKQPKQVTDSIMMIIEGEIMNSSDAFVDSIVNDECLKTSRQPLVVYLISLAISNVPLWILISAFRLPIVVCLMSEGNYDARVRMLIKHIAWQLRVTWEQLEDIETELAETLEYNTYVMSEEESAEKAKKAKNRKIKRYALIGLATVGGGALIGLTGGLAAPLVAAGAGAIIGGAGAAALGSAAGVAIIGSLFGVAGAGLTGTKSHTKLKLGLHMNSYKMKRRVGAIEEFSFEPLTLIGSSLQAHRTVKQLHITIAVTGWLNDKNPDFRMPWSALAESKEQYSLRWESKYLFQLGEAFDYLLQTGLSVATTEALKYTVLSALIAAVTWPAALISAAGVIDNPWHVCTQRSEAAGKQLAEVLLAREQGNRPVSLIGFSMGARAIFYCLEELSKRKGSEGLIEDVILLGAPVSGDAKAWMPFSKIVAGKIVNGYSRGDWLLKFLYRTANVKLKVAGLAPVQWENRRMHNIDLTDVIDGHGDYIRNLDVIMKAVGVRTKDQLKHTVPKSGSKTNIPKPAGNDDSESVNTDSSSVKQNKNNAECSSVAKNTTSGDLQQSHEELDNVSNEQMEHDVKVSLKTAVHVSNSNNIVSCLSSVVDRHASAVDNTVVENESEQESETRENTDLKTENFNNAKWESANEEYLQNSIDFTSSESGPYSKEQTPEVVSSLEDFNAKAEGTKDFDENPTHMKDKKKESEQRCKEPVEIRTATRVEDEIKKLIIVKNEGHDEGGMVKSESCYFTDSDPEGEA